MIVTLFIYYVDYRKEMGKNIKINKKTTWVICLAWVMIGLLLLSATYFTYANDFKKVSFSIDNNYIYDADQRDVLLYPVVDNNSWFYQFKVFLNHGEVNYLRIIINGMGDKPLKLTFVGLDENFNAVYSTTANNIKNGINDIRIEKQNYPVASIKIEGSSKIAVEKIQFRQSIEKHPLMEAAPLMVLVFLIYCLLSVLGGVIWEKVWPRLKKVIIDRKTTSNITMSCISKCIAIPIHGSLTSGARTILWTIMALNTIMPEAEYANKFSSLLTKELLIIGLMAILLNDKEHPTIRNKMDFSMAGIMVCYVAYTILSDLLVDKIPAFAGGITFLSIGLLSYIWNNKENNEQFLLEFERSVQVFLVLFTLWSIITNREITGGRYSGPIDNPSIFGLYLASIWSVLMASLEGQLRKKRKKTKFIIIAMELSLTMSLLLMSQSLTPLIACGVIFVLFIFRLVLIVKGKRFAIITILTSTIVIGLVLWFVINYSKYLGIESLRLVKKLESSNITAILNGRDYYYRRYLQEMNCFGHSKKPYLWGKRRLPHNALIGEAYVYGTPILVPYVLMMAVALARAWDYAKKDYECSAVPLYGIVAFVVMSIADNVDRYFIWLPWICCYVMFAPILFHKEENAILQKV